MEVRVLSGMFRIQGAWRRVVLSVESRLQFRCEMTLDISHILDDWPYEPGRVAARKVRGKDGREKIQLRLDLGLLQMATTGRPDGRRPHGCESLLDYYKHQLAQHKQEYGTDEGFSLDQSACELLRAESLMYYHRYLAEFVLEEYDAVERDTQRNLNLMDFCRTYAMEDSDRWVLEQYRQYVIMMRARARGHEALRGNRPRVALAAVRKGIKEIRTLYRRLGQKKVTAGADEIALLEAMIEDIKDRIPVDPVRKLKKELDLAVCEERYEDAAVLRDKLRHGGDDLAGPPRKL